MADSQPNLANNFKTDNVYMFVPNLIGYGRVFLALLSFWYMPTNCVAAGFCYLVLLQETLQRFQLIMPLLVLLRPVFK